MKKLNFLREINYSKEVQMWKWRCSEYRTGSYTPFIVGSISILIRYGAILGITKTYRFNSRQPNIQNIPKGDTNESKRIIGSMRSAFYGIDYDSESGDTRISKSEREVDKE